MDFHLDTLLNLPHATVEQCDQNATTVTLTPTFRRLMFIFSCALPELRAENLAVKGFQKWSNYRSKAAT